MSSDGELVKTGILFGKIYEAEIWKKKASKIQIAVNMEMYGTMNIS